MLARGENGRMASSLPARSSRTRLPHLCALLRADPGAKGLPLARPARQGVHRLVLQDAGREPVQDTIPGDAGTLPGEDHLPRMPRKPAEERSLICKGRGTHHRRTGRHAHQPAQGVFPHPGTERARHANRRPASERNKQPPRLSGRRGAELPDAEPPEQFAIGRRKPAHQPCHLAGKQPGRLLIYIRRAQHRAA